jgi:hypothetical protein
MDIKKIKFVANRNWLNKDSEFKPTSIIKTIPEWYRKMDRFAKIPGTNKFFIGSDKGKIPTWKACPAVFDIMGTGYTYLTPCDLNFFIDENNKLSVKIEDKHYKDFCTSRQPMQDFVTPHGYRDEHFAWFPDWGINLPDGYSALYSQPFNRFELPFLTISGIIDNDKIDLPGSMPFFISNNFVGTIPKGTPFAQILPFKRESWESEVITFTLTEMIQRNKKNSDKYRKPDGGVYKSEVWEMRKYV